MQFPRNEAPNNAALWLLTFVSKSLTSAETQYNNVEREVFGIIHGLEKFYHYYFTNKVNRLSDQKPPAVIFKRDVAKLSYKLQRMLLLMHQNNTKILYKPRLWVFAIICLS